MMIFDSTAKKTQENVKGFTLISEQVRSVFDENFKMIVVGTRTQVSLCSLKTTPENDGWCLGITVLAL